MRLNFQGFLETSTIHGLFYISKRFHLVERIFWIIAFILSVFCATLLIVQVAIKMHITPVVVLVADEPIPVTEIPFPAATVCPQLLPYIKLYGEFADYHYFYHERHTTERYYLENEEISEEIKYERIVSKSAHLKPFSLLDIPLDHYFSYLKTFSRLAHKILKPEELGLKLLKRLQVIDLVTDRGIFNKLNISVPADDFLDYINQFSKEFALTGSSFYSSFTSTDLNFVSEILTQHGLCYTTNIAFSHDLLNINETSDDFHYKLHQPTFLLTPERDSPPLEQPIKISSANSELYLSTLSDLTDAPEVFSNNVDGRFIMIHDPFELPSQNSKKFISHFSREATIWIAVKRTIIDDSLHDYTPEERNCYLENEKKLKYFKVYTRNNCEMECLSDFVHGRCGCVEFFMIRNSTMRICSASEKSCTEGAQKDFLEVMKDSCRCLQPCDHLEYSFEFDERGFLKQNEIPEYGDEDFVESIHSTYAHHQNRFGPLAFKPTIARVKFRQKDFELFVRKKQFNVLDFLSFVGGLLGLFAGFSAMSFVELIYWFTIRLVTKKLWSKVQPEEYQAPVGSVMRSYVEKSSIHGINFILSRTKLDSFIWIFLMLSSLTVCCQMILEVHEKVPNSRVTVYDDNFQPIEDVPFPAITFVPEYYWEMHFRYFDSKTWQPKLPKVASKNLSEQMIYHKRLTSEYFCFGAYDLYFLDVNLSFVKHHFSVLKEHSTVDWFRKQYSSLNGLYQPQFAEIRTSRGMGFTFNLIESDEMFDFSQVSEHYKYASNVTTANSNLKDISPSNYPLKFGTLDKPVLKLKLVRPETKDVVCILPSFFVHNSDYMPTFEEHQNFIHFQYGMIVNVEVTPKIIRVDDSLRKLEPNERDCYFEDERSLKYFKKYTQKNCEIECYTNKTFDGCGCTGLYQPFLSESEICLNRSRVYTHDTTCATDMKLTLDNFAYFSPLRNCSCLPLCNSITYNVKYTAEFNTKEATAIKTGNETELNVWMNMDEIILLRRYQQFTTSDVVSYVGGLLGLFAGISMLSIVEFLYFFTLRIVIDLWRKLRRRSDVSRTWVDGL